MAHWHWSPAGAWACLRAGTHYFDCFAKDTNFWLSRGAFRVCLWSGVPLKVFERDIDVPANRYYQLFHGHPLVRIVLAMMMPWHITRPDRMIALSAETRVITARAFDIPERHVLDTGFPRNDRFTSDASTAGLAGNERPASIQRALDSGRKVVLYMPTFRDSGRPYTRLDWQHLDALMRNQQATFFYKFHPLDSIGRFDRTGICPQHPARSRYLRPARPGRYPDQRLLIDRFRLHAARQTHHFLYTGSR